MNNPLRSAWLTLLAAGVVGILSFICLHVTSDLATAQGIAAAGATVIGVLLLTRLPFRRQWLGAGALLVVVIVLATGGFWFSFEAWGISDWDYYFSLHHTIRQTVLTYHQLPMWNPYTCGGTAALGDPEFSLFTPTFALELLLGIPAGLRAAIYLATITGGVGMLLLGKRIGLSVYAALAAAIAYALGSVNLLEIVEGHPNVFSAGWIPWIFWSWLAAYRYRYTSWKWCIACGAFLAVTFYQGGIYLLMYTALAFLVLPLLTTHPRRAYLVTLKSGLWALGLAALKLFPVLFWLRQFQDEMYAGSKYTLPHLYEIFLGRHLHDAEVFANQGSGWHEYGAYIGIVVAILALLAIRHIRQSRLVRALVIAALLATLVSSTGPLLEPLFDRAPFLPRSNISRFVLFAVIPLALLAGWGLDLLRRMVGPRYQQIVTLVIIGALAVDIMTLAYALSLQAFVLPPVVPAIASAPPPIAFTARTYQYRSDDDDYTRAYAASVAGYGTLSYCSVLTPVPGIRTIHDEVDNGYVSLSSSQASAQVVSWSPNRAVIAIHTPEQTDVVINTNFAKGWLVNKRAAQNIVGRPATRVVAGDHELTFQYHTPGFTLGVLITMITSSLVVIRLWWPILRKKRS